MSQSQQPTDSDESDRSAFKDLIQRNPDVCNNCFRRIRKRRPVEQVNVKGEPQQLRESMKGIVKDDNDYGQYAKFCNAEEPTDGMVPYCDCGYIFPGGDKDRPVDKWTIKTYSKRVVDRLREQGASIHRRDVIDRTMELKAKPSEQRMDDSILDRAVASAIDLNSIRNGDSDFQNPD